jgi:hypothetical protein
VNIEMTFFIIHIAGGILAIPSGFAALFLRKGARAHRLAGNLFAVSMVIMAIGASWLGYIHDDINDVISGFMTIYFVATAWMTARRKDKETGTFEKAALVAVLAGFAATLFFARGPANYIAAAFMGFAAALDLNAILRGGLSRKNRLARHLWRMCLAMFIAVGSFFLGQMQVFPEPIRQMHILSVPVIVVPALMVYWLIRVLYTDWPKKTPKPLHTSPVNLKPT